MRLRQLQPQIQIRLEDIRLRRHRLAIRRNRFLHFPQPIFRESQIEPRDIVCRISLNHFSEQRLGRRVIALLNESLRLGQLRWRLNYLFDCGVMDGLVMSFLAGRRSLLLRLPTLRLRVLRRILPTRCLARCRPHER
jgi:hypothetical protein